MVHVAWGRAAARLGAAPGACQSPSAARVLGEEPRALPSSAGARWLLHPCPPANPAPSGLQDRVPDRRGSGGVF